MEPTHSGPGYELYLGDCLEIMPHLVTGSVGAVIADPPYAVDLKYGGQFVDNVEYAKRFLPQLIDNGERLAKVALFPSGKFEIEKWLFAQRPPQWRICWYKGAQSTASAIGFCDWEMVLVYGKDVYRQTHDHFFAPTEPASNGHPCPKSIQWATWLICHFTKPGDIVLDPVMGSGTTGVACIQTGRRFIGCEIDPDYYTIAARRIQDAALQPQLLPVETTPVLEQTTLL